MLLLILLLHSALFQIIDITVAKKCEEIDTSLLPECVNIGYNFTANFFNVEHRSYQAYVSSEVGLFTARFNSCSPLSKAFICARYVPKCSESVEGPVLPCREVCEQFVDDCQTALNLSGLYNRYAAYCGLLSSQNDASTQCFKPSGFVPRMNRTKELRLPSCEAVTKPACVNNDLNSLGNWTGNQVQSALNSLIPVLSTNCSSKLKRLACFNKAAPCVNNGHTLFTCQSLCQEVRSSCNNEFERRNIRFFPKCIPNYSEVSAGDGLCRLLHWPVPWPDSDFKSGQKRLRCYCTNCGNNTSCATDGSCFVQRRNDVVVQTCLHKGPERDSKCNYTSSQKQNIFCCKKEFCNGKPQVGKILICVKPTENIKVNRGKGIVKKKNAPDNSKPDESNKEEKKGLNGGFLTLLVVGVLIVIFVIMLLLHTTIKKLKKNSRARRRGSTKYVSKSNISSNGRAVTIGSSNKGFGDGDLPKQGTALYY